MVSASYLVVRPMLVRLARRVAEGEVVTEAHECWVLVGVLVAALAADAGGTHAIFGAFVFGLAVPNGPVGVAVVEKVEDFVVGTLMPLFFAMSGLRTDTAKITSAAAAVLLMVAALAAAVLKVAAAVGVGMVAGWDDIDRFRTLGDPVQPDPRCAARYAEAYGQWRELGDLLTPVSHRLARKDKQ